MPTPKINGSVQPIRTKLSTRFDPAKGYIVTEEYESAGDNLRGLALVAANAGRDYTLDSNARKSRLVMSTTGASGFPEGTAVWQLYTNEYSKDILETDAALALGTGQLAQLQLDIEDIKNGGIDAYDAILSDTFYNTHPDAVRLVRYSLHGVTSINLIGYSATATISLPFLFAGAIPGVSPDSLMAQLIADIPVGGLDDGDLWKWGWRKLGTSRTFSGNNRTEIKIDWRLGSWAKLFFSDITALPA